MNIWIKNATILTMKNEKDILYNANLYIKDKHIFHVGKELNNFNADKIIDASNNLVMPGLINAHTHVAMSLLRNYANDLNLEEWLFDYIFPFENKLTPKDIYYGSLLGMLEMISTGTTTFVDMYFHENEVAKAALKTNMRAYLGRGLQADNQEQRAKETLSLYDEYNNKNDGALKVILAPHSIYTNTIDSLKYYKNLIPVLNNICTVHLNETKKEVNDSLKKYGKTPIAIFNELGYFKHKLVIAHADVLKENDIEILKNNNASVVFNPCSNMKLASGILPVQKLLDNKINIALGTDGPSSNNNLNMFEEMKFASLLAKVSCKDPKSLKAFDTLKLATVNGAKALGREHELGLIAKDYLADLIMVNLDTLQNCPQVSLIDALVYSISGHDVYTTIINGKIVYENKKFVDINIKNIKNKVNEIYQRIIKE